jgi:hypothetical protein
MNQLKTLTTVSCMALASILLTPIANADEWNKKTVITFSGPVEIPGVHLAGWRILPAGTYVFKILDSQSDRHIVQIFNKEETTIYATILAIPNQRLTATGKTVMTFRERPAGQPEALRAWFYPGSTSGEEFVYSKVQAAAIAKDTNTPVLFTPAEMPVEVAEPVKLSDAPVVAEMKRAPIMAITPTGKEVQIAEVVTPPAPLLAVETPNATPAPASQPVAAVVADTPPPTVAPGNTLPATASNLPLIGLLGLVALGGAFIVRAAANRV